MGTRTAIKNRFQTHRSRFVVMSLHSFIIITMAVPDRGRHKSFKFDGTRQEKSRIDHFIVRCFLSYQTAEKDSTPRGKGKSKNISTVVGSRKTGKDGLEVSSIDYCDCPSDNLTTSFLFRVSALLYSVLRNTSVSPQRALCQPACIFGIGVPGFPTCRAAN